VVCTAYVLGSWFDLVSIRPKLIRTGSSDSIPARETLASVDVYTMTWKWNLFVHYSDECSLLYRDQLRLPAKHRQNG
jgi:hypothetical protein